MNNLDDTDPNLPVFGCRHGGPTPRQIGRIQIERELGRGRVGIVYLGYDHYRLCPPVAVKVPFADRIDTDAYIAHVRAVASLSHPSIVPVYEAGSTNDCPCFVVSKYVEGRSLRKFIVDENPTPIEASRLIVTLADALDVAYQKNLRCLDIRPVKILVDAQNRPLLMGEDFLPVKWLERGGCVFGFPYYMSPEQIAGDEALVGPASDIFSLGLVFYELLTGRRPYRSRGGIELCQEILDARIEPPSRCKKGIPLTFDKICATALAKSPTARYRRMADFADAIRFAMPGK